MLTTAVVAKEVGRDADQQRVTPELKREFGDRPDPIHSCNDNSTVFDEDEESTQQGEYCRGGGQEDTRRRRNRRYADDVSAVASRMPESGGRVKGIRLSVRVGVHRLSSV